MIIYNERLVKFQGYREGTFYILRYADIDRFVNTDYLDLEESFSLRKNAKDTFLYENRLRQGNYIIIRRNDFFSIKKYVDSIDRNFRYGEARKKLEECNFVYNTDFKYIDTICVISPYIQERFIQNEDISLLENEQVQNDYMDMYIDSTPFFKAFSEKKLYYHNGEYYLYCKAADGESKYEFVFDLDTLKDLFRKYQNPDCEPFSEEELKRTKNGIVVQEEKEEVKVNIDKSFADILKNIETLSVVSKKEESDRSEVEDIEKMEDGI